MLKKLSFFLLAFAFPVMLFAQSNVIIRADGTILKPGQLKTTGEVQYLSAKELHQVTNFKKSFDGVKDLDDTLSWHVPRSVNFGFFGQDRMVQWFEAPADMIIKGAGYNTAAVDVENTPAELKLVTVNWTKDQILNAGVKRWGYYVADGNGYHDATAFFDDLDRTGDWVDIEGSGAGSPFGADLWSDGGLGAPVTPVADGKYQWVDMNLLGFEPTVTKGTLVGVALKNNNATMDQARIGFIADNSLGIPGFKYYANGRLDPPNDYGWWTRKYTWDFVLAVTLTGDIAPYINDMTELPTTLSTDARTVQATITDVNPSGGSAGVKSASLWYSVNGGDFTEVAMTKGDGDVYSAQIPGQEPGSQVDYYVTATDVNDNQSQSKTVTYYIFKPTASNLLVFSGYDKPAGYPQSYYFGHDDFTTYSTVYWDHDVWCYGATTDELLGYYTNVFEIATKGPNVDNIPADSAWVAADGGHNYFLAGDEWFGAYSGWVNIDHDGDFANVILGVTKEFNDINYGASGDQLGPSVVMPVAGTTLGGALANLFSATGDTMWYYPYYEIGVTNWLDGANFTDDVEVFMQGVGADGNTYNIAGSRVLSAGNKIVFMGYDPLSLDAPAAQYYWYGFSKAAPQVQALIWFGIDTTVSVRQIKGLTPETYSLGQNYPNPFNPTTIITFALPQRSDVSLKVYDLLGREVATLVSGVKEAGKYEVEFNAKNLASGMYVYQLKAGNFVSTKKMMLMK